MILEKQGSIIMVNFKRNYQVYLSISNFETRAKELIFDDFKIISIEQGSEAKGKTWEVQIFILGS